MGRELSSATPDTASSEGVWCDGESSFTIEDVLVEQCGIDSSDVLASGTSGVGRCANVKVRQCGYSGVHAEYGASITLIGAKTTMHHNCTKGHSDHYVESLLCLCHHSTAFPLGQRTSFP